MALPPIVTNFPLFKLFRSEQPKAGKTAKTADTKLTQDVVQISSAAKASLDGTKKLSEKDVPAVVAKTKNILAGSILSLGLDPGFTG